ncbi:MAG: hypothetical protein ACLQVY_22890 [Limisphaerales bacterium]
MNAYFLTAGITRFQISPGKQPHAQRANQQQRWVSCNSLIVCDDTANAARKWFEQSLSEQPEDGGQIDTQIDRIVAAQFLDQMLAETGFVPLDWTQVASQAQSDLELVSSDDFEQGYWVDVNEVVLPSSNIEALRDDLPEDIRSGLNWAEDKQFFFLLSILSPPKPPPVVSEDELEAAAESPPETEGEAGPDLAEPEIDFPGLVEKEAAVLIRARNSAVAAWLWRRYAPDAKLAKNQLRVDPWCGLLRAEDANRG